MLAPACAFCQRDALDAVLTESEHFYVLADHAPLIEGHTLLIPKQHFACYGALPEELDAELLALKGRVATVLSTAYRAPVFFEHGVFHQSVFHAHLHAIPFGGLDVPPDFFRSEGAHPVSAPEDLRHWYASAGHYFYLEMPQPAGDAVAAVFPPDETRYWQVLAALRHATQRRTEWHPQAVRREQGRPSMHSLQDKWHAFDRD